MEPLVDKICTEVDIRNYLLEVLNAFDMNKLTFTKEDREKYKDYILYLINKGLIQFKENYNKYHSTEVGSFFITSIVDTLKFVFSSLLKIEDEPYTVPVLLYILNSSIDFPKENNVELMIKLIDYINDSKGNVSDRVNTFNLLISKEVDPLTVIEKIKTVSNNWDFSKGFTKDIRLLSEDILEGTDITLVDIKKNLEDIECILKKNHDKYSIDKRNVLFSVREQDLYQLNKKFGYKLSKVIYDNGKMFTLANIDGMIFVLFKMKLINPIMAYGLQIIHEGETSRRILQISLNPEIKYELKMF